MKKLLSLILTITLLTGLGAPALAADKADERLAAVTQKVKQTLNLNTDGFDTFYGNMYEDSLSPVWSLSWSGNAGSLSIQADENGGVLSYNFYDSADPRPYSSDFSPTFPDGEESSARAAAAAFLKQVLDPALESVSLSPDTGIYLGTTQYNYSGSLLIHNLPSPFSYYISVRAADNTVMHFSRDSLSTKYLGGIPSSTPAVEQDAAGGQLKTTLSLRLEYVLAEDGKTAVLRYLPEYGDQYYVDAQTGKLVNLSEIYREVSESGNYGMAGDEKSAAASASADTGSGGLTGPEQKGISKLEGVLTKEELDAGLRKITQLGLSKYALSSVNYWVDQTDGSVTCNLQYARQTDEGLWRRFVSVDGKTGELQSVGSSIPWSGDGKRTAAVTADGAQKNAESFLKAYYGEDFAKLALYNDSEAVIFGDYDASYNFHYAQKENGYFYAGNYYSVGIDGTDGSVSSFGRSFNRDLAFDSADGIVAMDSAIQAYYDSYQVPLGYTAVPQQLDPNAPEYAPLIKLGYSYLYTLKLAYTLEQAKDSYVQGIDAKTGTPVISEYGSEQTSITYSDLSGHWVESQAEKLAQYNVGWLGGALNPGSMLTQFDLLCLLVSTNGYLYDPANIDQADIDKIYNVAYGMNLLKPDQRSDDKEITRGELVKLILNAGGYGEVAGLTGIFRCNYQDEKEIPAAYYGYAALAQGLGIVGGDGKGSFAASRTATRAEAVVMLYNLMSR